MRTAIGADVITQLTAAADTGAASSSGVSWWDVTSGLLLAVAGMWATWAQFVYPKIAERKSRTDPPTPPAAATPATPPVDLVGVAFRDQAQRLDDVLEQLEVAHRRHARDSGTIGRLTAELAEARRQTCTHVHPGRNLP